MQPATSTRRERRRAQRRSAATPCRTVANPPVRTRGNDRLARLDLDSRGEFAAQPCDRPDAESEAKPHHDESASEQRQRRRRLRQRRGDRRADGHAQRQRDQDASPAISVATTHALDALAYPDAQFQQRPRREGETDRERHAAVRGYSHRRASPSQASWRCGVGRPHRPARCSFCLLAQASRCVSGRRSRPPVPSWRSRRGPTARTSTASPPRVAVSRRVLLERGQHAPERTRCTLDAPRLHVEQVWRQIRLDRSAPGWIRTNDLRIRSALLTFARVTRRRPLPC